MRINDGTGRYRSNLGWNNDAGDESIAFLSNYTSTTSMYLNMTYDDSARMKQNNTYCSSVNSTNELQLLRISESTINGSSGAIYGGAVIGLCYNARSENSVYYGNDILDSSALRGGAVMIHRGCASKFSDNIFEGNKAIYGGSIGFSTMFSSDEGFDNCTNEFSSNKFVSNMATTDGAGIAIRSQWVDDQFWDLDSLDDLPIEFLEYWFNESLSGSSVSCSFDDEYYNNTAGYYGGALLVSSNDWIEDSYFREVDIAPGNGTETTYIYQNETTNTVGGAAIAWLIEENGESMMEISSSEFTSITAGETQGGAIFTSCFSCLDDSLEMKDYDPSYYAAVDDSTDICEYCHSTIYNTNDTKLALSSTNTFYNNSVAYGGSLIINCIGEFMDTNSQYTENNATYYGGSVYTQGVNTVLYSSSISGSYVAQKGAGMYGGCINSFSLSDSTVSDTECETGCGVFLTDIFENNYGNLVGGAVAMFIHSHEDNDTSISIFDCEFIDNMAHIKKYFGYFKGKLMQLMMAQVIIRKDVETLRVLITAMTMIMIMILKLIQH